jgi:chaperonin GroES
MLNLDRTIRLSDEVADSKNLATAFSEADQSRIAGYAWDGFTHDWASCQPWRNRMQSAMDFAMQVQKPKTFPWPGASNVIFPLITISSLQFSAQSYPALISGNNIVRYRTIGTDIGPPRERALRVGRHMSWQVTEEDESWEEQHDRLLFNLPIVGTGFVKSYYAASKGYPVDEFVLAKDLIVNYGAKSIDGATRKTHVLNMFRNEIWESAARGKFSDVREAAWFQGTPAYNTQDTRQQLRNGMLEMALDAQTPFRIMEQHCWIDLDGDGYEEPYIVTFEEQSKALLRLVARWNSEKDVERDSRGRIIQIRPIEYFTKYSFIPSPDGGFYDLGFGTFLGPINESVNTAINIMLDNGVLQNSIGGFLGRGAKIRGGVYTMAPFQWQRVDSTGDDLRKNIVPYPKAEASRMLYELLVLLVNYANRVAGTTDTVVGENPGQNTPASTYQGMTEQGMRIYSAIYTRVWRAMKDEFRKRYDINARVLPGHKPFGSGGSFIRREDYQGPSDQIAPVASRRVTSTTLRLQQALAIKQDSHITPGYDVNEVTRDYLRALGLDEEIERLYPGPTKTPPLPNPKLQVEQAKGQIVLAREKLSLQSKAQALEEQRRLNNAKIAQLESQSLLFLKQAGTKNAEIQLRAFDTAINAMKEHSKALTDHINALLANAGGSDENSGAGMGGVEGASGNSGADGVSGSPSESTNGAVGGG